MAVIQGITAEVIVDGQPLEEFNADDDVDEGVDNDSDSDHAASRSDDDDQKYIDDQKAQQGSVNPSRRRYFGPNRQVTKYIPSVSDASFEVKVGLSRSRIQRHKSGALVIILFVDGNHMKSYTWMKKYGDSLTFKDIVVATPAGPFRKPFLFSEIVTSKYDKYDLDLGKHLLTQLCLIGNDHSDIVDAPQKIIDGMGTIMVRIYRATMGKRIRTNYKVEVFKGLQAVSEIAEHKLKGKSLTHSTK